MTYKNSHFNVLYAFFIGAQLDIKESYSNDRKQVIMKGISPNATPFTIVITNGSYFRVFVADSSQKKFRNQMAVAEYLNSMVTRW